MYEQNSLEKILYGNTNGKKSFSQFRKGRVCEEKNSSLEEDTDRSSKKRKDTVRRMEGSHQKRNRDKKIKKLESDSSHWRGLS